MNRLNPLYIIGLALTILFLSFYLLNNEKINFNDKKVALLKIKSQAKDFKDYKKNWNNEKFVTKTLDNILNSRAFSNQKILRAKTKNTIKVKVQSTNQRILNSFLNKILNKNLIIKKIDLEKNSINIEIGIN
jgi:hypothetical protein